MGDYLCPAEGAVGEVSEEDGEEGTSIAPDEA